MASKRKNRSRQAQLAFDALAIEGGLLSPEWLSRVAQLQAGSQSESDYRVPKGLNLRDEIGRYWRIAQAHWAEFAQGRNANADGKALAERFVTSLLRDSFGFASLAVTEPMVIAGRAYPIGHTTLGGRVPVVIAPPDAGLDDASPAFGDSGRRRTAFGLTQEFLNAHEGALWGLTSDGNRVRISRDNASLTRPAWIEADLVRIFTEERYADFAALWLLVHETRFGREEQPATDCVLENWRNAGREEGTRAREDLRRGVEAALIALGQGFLAHSSNGELRTNLQSGTLATKDYFNQLLRLVYRMIFLLTVEERGLLHPPGTNDEAVSLYAQGYAMRRLRERSVRRNAHDRFSDLWEAVKIAFRGLAAGEPRLGLPALAGIFAITQCPALDVAKLENRWLMLAMFKLAWLREEGALARVNWRDMGPEELGSVYESLLELVPEITHDGRQFEFAGEGGSVGHARKETSSYYTHDAIVQALLDCTLEPAIKEAVAQYPEGAVAALLSLAVVDPACGSGHFLLGAARRLAMHVARLQANGTPSALQYRRALRDVVSRCIYGVDLNPMAVELCKVGLWMEALDPELPLTFLDAHIQRGNALLGTTPDLMANGIPDDAWDAIADDDKDVARALRKRNKAEAGGQRALQFNSARRIDEERKVVARAVAALEEASDRTAEALANKEAQWDQILNSAEYKHQKLAADTWCAAFVWPKQHGELDDAAPTNDIWRRVRDGEGVGTDATLSLVRRLSDQFGFFHWHLQFPQIFVKGGFDIVLGNPPWKPLSPDVKEFFSVYDPGVRNADAETQGEVVGRLLENPAVHAEWDAYCDRLYRSVHFFRNSGAYQMFAPGNLGKGDFNIYRMFVERALTMVRLRGYAAQLVPENLYNGANAMALRKELFDRFQLRALFGFENAREVWFTGIDSRTKFCLYVAQRGGATACFPALFGLRTTDALQAATSGQTLGIPVSLVAEFSPNALAVMEFTSQQEIDIAKKMYARWPKFGDEIEGLPQRQYMREVDMDKQRRLFTDDPSGVPVYEGRMVWQYDHRAKAYKSGRGRSAEWVDLEWGSPRKGITPQWYISQVHLPERILDRVASYRIGFCDVASPTNERSLVAAIIPPSTVCGHKVPTLMFRPSSAAYAVLWVAVANSFVLDFLVRKKVSLTMSYTVVDSLPLPRQMENSTAMKRIVLLSARLTCTSPEMAGFWTLLCADGWLPGEDPEVPRGCTEPAERIEVRAELDAVVAWEIYGVTRDEIEFILSTFPTSKKYEEQEFGEFRTQRLIFEIYDSMAEAERTGKPYQTRLNPPPADPSVVHPSHGGQVLPFRVAAPKTVQPAHSPPDRQLPAWSPGLLPAAAAATGLNLSGGSWATSLSGFDLGMTALAAVLRNVGGPSSREAVERAVVLTVLPGMLQTKLDIESAGTWRQVIGPSNIAITSIASVAIPWDEVVQHARIEQVLDDALDGRWSAGPDVQDAPSRELDARAIVSLSWLAHSRAEDQEVTNQLGVLRAG
jgi:hypothetical protein